MNNQDLNQLLIEPWLAGLVTTIDGPIIVDRMYETHTSFVFLDATHAFKVRKPVDLGFLDYQTLGSRKESTLREYSLGSAISPQVYHGVWSLTADDNVLHVSQSNPVAEPVLSMRRLAPELCCAELFANQDVPATDLDSMLNDCCS